MKKTWEKTIFNSKVLHRKFLSVSLVQLRKQRHTERFTLENLLGHLKRLYSREMNQTYRSVSRFYACFSHKLFDRCRIPFTKRRLLTLYIPACELKAVCLFHYFLPDCDTLLVVFRLDFLFFVDVFFVFRQCWFSVISVV